jgi:pilus assembly protein CpaE
MALRNVLLLSSDLATVTSVSKAMSSNGQLESNNVCRDISELSRRLKDSDAPAVLVDIDREPQSTLSQMEPLARRFSDTKFIVLSGLMRQDLLLEAMQAGARHFLLKEAVSADLNGVLHRLCRNGDERASGKVVTILSAGGGCGATTVAVNLAAELQASEGAAEDKPALVVDLDCHYGALATYLGVDSEYGMFDLMNRSSNIDGHLIQSSSVTVSKQMHVMVSVPRNKRGEAIPVDPSRLGQVVECCRRAYDWTVIDAPRLPLAAIAELIQHSSATLLLMQLTVKDIHVARQTVAGLAALGVSPDAVTLLANRYCRRSRLISLGEAETALGLDKNKLGTLSNDFSAVTEAVNLGKPLVQAAPRSSFRRDLQKLATKIAAASVSSDVLQESK